VVIARTLRTRDDLPVIESNDPARDHLLVLTEHRRDLVEQRVRTIMRMQTVLTSISPALGQVLDLSLRGPVHILTQWRTPAAIRKAGYDQIHALLKQYKINNAKPLAAAVVAAARAQTIHIAGEAAYAAVLGRLAIDLRDLTWRIETVEAQIADALAGHPLAEIVLSMPGMGTILTAESLAHAGTDTHPTPSRLAAHAGFAPVNRDSGSVTGNLKRPHRFHRVLRRVFLMSALTALKSHPESTAYYRRKRAEGMTHPVERDRFTANPVERARQVATGSEPRRAGPQAAWAVRLTRSPTGTPTSPPSDRDSRSRAGSSRRSPVRRWRTVSATPDTHARPRPGVAATQRAAQDRHRHVAQHRVGADRGAQLQPGHAGHVEVGQDHIRSHRRGGLQSGPALGCGQHGEPGADEQPLQHGADVDVVLGDENHSHDHPAFRRCPYRHRPSSETRQTLRGSTTTKHPFGRATTTPPEVRQLSNSAGFAGVQSGEPGGCAARYRLGMIRSARSRLHVSAW
jgi:hypothetical protein